MKNIKFRICKVKDLSEYVAHLINNLGYSQWEAESEAIYISDEQ